MQPALSRGQRCHGVISVSLSSVLLEEIVHCSLLLTQSLQRWAGQLRCPCLLAPWTLLRHLCPSVSLPWFLFLSLLATIGAAYPGIRLFCIPYRIVWTYQHPLCFLISIPYLFLFLSQCMGQPFSLAVWEECCELIGLGCLSFRTGKTQFDCPVLQCMGFGDELVLVLLYPCPCPCCEFLRDSWNVQV